MPRFSRLALACFGVLGVTGVYLAWRQAGELAALPATGFGRLLLIKSAVVLVIVGIAYFSRRAVARGGDFAGAAPDRRWPRRCWGSSCSASPPGWSTPRPRASSTRRRSTSPSPGPQKGKVQVHVVPAKQGQNITDIYLVQPDGKLLVPPEITARLKPPKGEKDLGPLPGRADVRRAGALRCHGDDASPTPATGTWSSTCAPATSTRTRSTCRCASDEAPRARRLLLPRARRARVRARDGDPRRRPPRRHADAHVPRPERARRRGDHRGPALPAQRRPRRDRAAPGLDDHQQGRRPGRLRRQGQQLGDPARPHPGLQGHARPAPEGRPDRRSRRCRPTPTARSCAGSRPRAPTTSAPPRSWTSRARARAARAASPGRSMRASRSSCW